MLSAAAITSCGVTSQQAVEYNDKIIHEQTIVYNKELALMEAMKNYKDMEGMKKAQDELINSSKSSIQVIKNLDKFDGSTEFADAAIIFLETYKGFAEKEYNELIELYSLPQEDYTEEKENRANELFDIIEKAVDTSIQKFGLAQDAFATKYKIELVDKDV